MGDSLTPFCLPKGRVEPAERFELGKGRSALHSMLASLSRYHYCAVTLLNRAARDVPLKRGVGERS